MGAAISVGSIVSAILATYFLTRSWPYEYHLTAMKIAFFLPLVIAPVAGTVVQWLLIKNYELLQKVEQMAELDDLTGLFNRRAFMERASESDGRKRVVLVADVDWFKRINDTMGHAAGDAALRHLAEVLRKNTPDDWLIARLGGEEFVALYEGVILSEARQKTEALRAAVQTSPFSFDGKVIEMTISIGLAMGAERDTIEALLKRADAAMYRAKESGRNQTLLAA
ncbi:MAG: GGDEF domain-containing protein [Rhizobiaceae bacterium]